MKVLWFTLTPSLSEGYLKNIPTGGGWIKSLEKIIQSEVDLTIAFYTDLHVSPFDLGLSHYYPIHKYKFGVISKIKRKILNELEPNNDLKIFLKIIDEVKPDIIHIHGTEAPFGLIQNHVKTPTIVSIQGNITVYCHKYYTGIGYFDILKFSSLKNYIFRRTFNTKYKYFKKQSAREQEIFKHTKNIIGRTSWDKRITSVLAPQAIYYHNDEILRNVFYETKWAYKEQDSINLFTTNGPNIYKGIETLIHCAHLLDSIGIKYKWSVAGLNNNDEIIKIAAGSLKIKVSNNIIFLGSLNENQLIKEMLKSNIYLAISHIENSPNSLCEAMMIGMPCIATNAGGTQSLIVNNQDGILIQDGDPYAMAGAIIELVQNNDKAITLGKKAKESALLRHDPIKISKDLLEIYNQLILHSN